MAENTDISWTDATFNPWIGCTKVSPGCDNCYAAQQDSFRKWTPAGWGAGMPRKRTKTWGDPVKWNARPFVQCGSCGWRGDDPHEGTPGWVECPMCGKNALAAARRRVFCASLADVFDNEVDPQWRADLFALILRTPNLDWLMLTKRIGNVYPMLEQLRHPADEDLPLLDMMPLPNLWLGATIVNQEEADRDIPKLLATPARVRFLSCEPLLGPVDLRHVRHETQVRSDDTWTLNMNALTGFYATSPYSGTTGPKLDWVIVGGESGTGARPMHPDWARSLRDQCASAGVPLHFKQWGEWKPLSQMPVSEKKAQMESGRDEHWLRVDGTMHSAADSDAYNAADILVAKVGKKAAGRLLDGVEHNGFPEVAC